MFFSKYYLALLTTLLLVQISAFGQVNMTLGSANVGSTPEVFTVNGATSGVTLTVCPNAPRASSDFVRANFTAFSDNFIWVEVFNGTGTGNLIGSTNNFLVPSEFISTATDGCLTFRVNNNFTGTRDWTATLETVSNVVGSGTFSLCTGDFYDDGSISSNYSTAGGTTNTVICPDGSGNYSNIEFTSLNIHSSDRLNIYDGTTAGNLLSTFSGDYSGLLPLTVSATGSNNNGGCLTAEFVNNGDGFVTSGWEADISCSLTPDYNTTFISGNVAICGGTFLDPGGYNTVVYGNYPSTGGTTTSIICPDASGNYANIEFTTLSIHGTETLNIYDGTTSGSLLATFSGDYSGILPLTISATDNNDNGGCLTAEFINNGDGFVTTGWEATISCSVTPTENTTFLSGSTNLCGGNFADLGGVAPTPSVYGQYPPTNNTTTICPSSPGEFVTLDFNNLVAFPGAYIDINISDSEDDQLYIYDGASTNGSTIIASFKGFYTAPASISASNSTGCLTTVFEGTTNRSNHGWNADISCSTTPGTNTIIASSSNITCTGMGTPFQSVLNSNNRTIANRTETITICGTPNVSGVSVTLDYLELGFMETLTVYDANVATGNTLFDETGVQRWWNTTTLGGAPFFGFNDTNLNFTSTNPEGCLTFVYETNGGNTIGFSGSTICQNVPLPVTISSYKAELVKENIVQLSWFTATELNNDFFSIEKSTDGFLFEEIARIKGKGNSNSIISYQYYDTLNSPNQYYYRLKQQNFNGVSEYSKVVSVKSELNKTPNHLNVEVNRSYEKGGITVTVKNQGNIATQSLLTMYTLSGQIIYQSNCDINEQINIKVPKPGIYIININSNIGNYQDKIMIQ